MLNALYEPLNRENEDIIRIDKKYWSTFRSIKKNMVFAYLQPQKHAIRVFPGLPIRILESLNTVSLEIKTMPRGGGWGESYECWFKISQENQIPDAHTILKRAYREI